MLLGLRSTRMLCLIFMVAVFPLTMSTTITTSSTTLPTTTLPTGDEPGPAPAWSLWSACSHTCGIGEKYRSRPCPPSDPDCEVTSQSRHCIHQSCDVTMRAKPHKVRFGEKTLLECLVKTPPVAGGLGWRFYRSVSPSPDTDGRPGEEVFWLIPGGIKVTKEDVDPRVQMVGYDLLIERVGLPDNGTYHCVQKSEQEEFETSDTTVVVIRCVSGASVCLNGGACLLKDEEPDVVQGSFECSCTPGYTGEFCEKLIVPEMFIALGVAVLIFMIIVGCCCCNKQKKYVAKGHYPGRGNQGNMQGGYRGGYPPRSRGYNQHSPGGPPPRGPPSRGPGPRKGGRGHSERHSVPPDYSSYSSVFTTSESVFSDAKDKRKSRNREKRSKDKDESDFPSVFSEEEKEKKRERRRSRSREKKKKKDKTKERDQSRSKKQDRSSKRDKSERRKESSGKAKEKRKKEKSRSNNNNNILSSSESSLCHLTEQVLLVIDTDDEYTTVSE